MLLVQLKSGYIYKNISGTCVRSSLLTPLVYPLKIHWCKVSGDIYGIYYNTNRLHSSLGETYCICTG